MNLDPDFLTILLHGVPVFGDARLGLDQLLPGDRRAARGDLHHFNAAIHRADVEAEPAAHAIGLADHRTGSQGGGFQLAVRVERISIRLDHHALVVY